MTQVTMFRGDTQAIEVTVSDADGGPFDLTGATVRFTAKTDIDQPDTEAQVAKENGNGVTLTDPTQGKCVVEIEPVDTHDLVTDGAFRWDIQVSTSAGRVYTVAVGTLNVKSDITRTSGPVA